MSSIAAIQTQADLLINGSAPPNDHFLHPKAPPTMPWEMKYEERRHCSQDPRIKKQLQDERQFEETIVQHVWSDVVAKFASTLEERWMTAVDLERMLLSQGVTNARLRGKICDVLDTTGVIFDGSSSSSANNNNNNNGNNVFSASVSTASAMFGNTNNKPELQQFRGLLKKGMNVNTIMNQLFSEEKNSNDDDDGAMNERKNTSSHPGHEGGGHDDNDMMSMMMMNDDTNTVATSTSRPVKETNHVRLTNLRNEMRWNGIVVCKQIQLLLSDQSRQDDFIEACFDKFDRADPSKRIISKNSLLHTELKPIDPEEDPYQTFRWFDTPQVPESAKQYTKEQSQNPKIQKEITRYLDAQRKKIEEQSTFVLPDLPGAGGKKKKKKKRRKKGEVELPTRMIAGATFHQLEPLKNMILMNDIGNQFYPHITYDDFKAAFLNPQNSQWVASFLGVILEAMATFCTVKSNYSTSELQQQASATAESSILLSSTTARSMMTRKTNNNNNNNNTLNSTTASSTLRGTTGLNQSAATSSSARERRGVQNQTSSSSSSLYSNPPQTSNISAPLPPLPWLTKTLHTVPSAPLMADADIFLLLQLERAGGSATDPVEKKKKKKKRRGSSSNSSSPASSKPVTPATSVRGGGGGAGGMDDTSTTISRAKMISEEIFSTSGISAANDFLASMKGGENNNNNTSKLPAIGSTTGTNNNNKDNNNDDDEERKKRTRVKFVQ